MGTKTVRLREDVYERIRSRKRDDETFSEAIDRLTGDASLGDLAGSLTDEEAEAAEEAADASAEADRRESDALNDGA